MASVFVVSLHRDLRRFGLGCQCLIVATKVRRFAEKIADFAEKKVLFSRKIVSLQRKTTT